jgi:hypothetical protein
MHVVGNGECIARSNLEFPLTRHHFGVGAGDEKTCVDASLSVLFDDVTTNNAACANAAVVRTLWLWVTANGETVW